MDAEKRNGFIEFIKKYGMFVVVGIVIVAVALTFTLVAALGKTVPTGTTNLNFKLPMSEASIIKDFSDTELQNNETLNQWEAHLYVDFASENKDVFAVLGGTVEKIENDYLDGFTITIKHSDGFESIYSSLSETRAVKVGDKVESGQKIGTADETAVGEQDMGAHLHFAMKLNDKFVDPNNYLDLQQK